MYGQRYRHTDANNERDDRDDRSLLEGMHLVVDNAQRPRCGRRVYEGWRYPVACLDVTTARNRRTALGISSNCVPPKPKRNPWRQVLPR